MHYCVCGEEGGGAADNQKVFLHLYILACLKI